MAKIGDSPRVLVYFVILFTGLIRTKPMKIQCLIFRAILILHCNCWWHFFMGPVSPSNPDEVWKPELCKTRRYTKLGVDSNYSGIQYFSIYSNINTQAKILACCPIQDWWSLLRRCLCCRGSNKTKRYRTVKKKIELCFHVSNCGPTHCAWSTSWRVGKHATYKFPTYLLLFFCPD